MIEYRENRYVWFEENLKGTVRGQMSLTGFQSALMGTEVQIPVPRQYFRSKGLTIRYKIVSDDF